MGVAFLKVKVLIFGTFAFGGTVMRETRVTLPELALIAGTRAALGAGLGLLLADRLSPEQRRAAGWALLLFGVLTTVPLAFEVFGRPRLQSRRTRDVSPPLPKRSESEPWTELSDRLHQRAALLGT
jgi:uncharacterized membrane protein YfcA